MTDYELHIESIPYRKGDPLPDISAHVAEVRHRFGIDESNTFLSLERQVAGMTGDEATLFYYTVKTVEVADPGPRQMRVMLADMIDERTRYKQKAERLRAELWENVVALMVLRADGILSQEARQRIDKVIQSMQAVLVTTDPS